MENQNRPRAREDDAWHLDPSDIARHAQLRRRRERPRRFGGAVGYFVAVLALAGAFAAYWNFDTLRQVTVEAPALSALLKRLSSQEATVPASAAPEHDAVVESIPVAGTAAPTSIGSARDAEPPLKVAKVAGPPATPSDERAAAPSDERAVAPSDAAPPSESREAQAAESTAAAQSLPAAETVATDAAAPEQPAPPPQPETIGFALSKITVSERDAFAAVLVARSGGNNGPSTFTWWTSDGTAKAGKDYVDLGKVVVKFAAGERNRAIQIPIVGDQVAEDTESFYVNLAPGDDPSAEPQDRVEVVIEDDDGPLAPQPENK